jgi:hypothetical protein
MVRSYLFALILRCCILNMLWSTDRGYPQPFHKLFTKHLMAIGNRKSCFAEGLSVVRGYGTYWINSGAVAESTTTRYLTYLILWDETFNRPSLWQLDRNVPYNYWRKHTQKQDNQNSWMVGSIRWGGAVAWLVWARLAQLRTRSAKTAPVATLHFTTSS